MWCAAHAQAVEEAMEADDTLTWSQAYESDSTAKRADEILRDRVASLIDEARDRAKYADVK
jgi:hypothetical protein